MTKPMIQVTAKSIFRVVVSTVFGGSLMIATASLPAQAQSTRPSPLEDLQTKDGSDFFNGRGNSQTGGVMNFIQNAIIGTPRSTDEFAADQRENFDEATSLFRKQQADRLRRQQPQPNPDSQVAPLPTNPVTSPAPN
ncbi:MAG: hypothetical protein NW224_15385 [Leptolyngbyaceae cyanobacterium bins.302]|nr:hypothetical protein [Leptolyngbyaceae cyanobacterium bins.302]